MTQDNNLPQTDRISQRHLSLQPSPASSVEPQRFTQIRVRIQIPPHYRQEPVISRLATHNGLEVNVLAALLGADARGSGWFDLELRGTPQQIDSALIYLSDLDVQVWQDSDAEQDGW